MLCAIRSVFLCTVLFATPVFAQDAALGLTAPTSSTSDRVFYDPNNLKPEGNLTLGLWYSQAESVSGTLGIEQEGVFGTDENFRLGLEASSYTQTAQITLTDPDFFESAYSRQLSLSMYNIQPNRAQNGTFSFSGVEGTISFGRQFTEELSLSFGGGLGRIRTEQNVNLPDFIQNYISLEGEENNKSFAFLHLLYDRTDKTAYPLEGYRVGMTNELGSVGGTAYLKSQVRGSYFVKASERTGIRVHGNVGLANTLGSGAFPIFENFYAGGPGSVRGYGQNTLGPTSNIPNQTSRAYTGGMFNVVGGIEVSTRLGDRDDLYALGFYDIGNVFASGASFDSTELRSSIGVGVRWDSPIGALNVYMAKPINNRADDNVEQLQFTLGAHF